MDKHKKVFAIKWKRVIFILLLTYFITTMAVILYFGILNRRLFPASSNALAEELTNYFEAKWVEKYEANQKRYQFETNVSEEELAKLAETVRNDYQKWIQFQPHKKQINKLHKELIGEFSEHTLYSISFKNANSLTVEGIISVPKQEAEIYPVLIIPNGTSASADEIFGLTNIDYHFEVGNRFAKDYIVFAVNIPPTTDDFGEAVASNNRNFYLSNSAGLNWAYYQIPDKISSAIDYLENEPKADGKRIAIYGISLGGATAIIASLFDDRISVTIPSGTNVFTPTDVQLLENRRFTYPHWYPYNIVESPNLFQLLYALYPNQIIIEINEQDTTGVFSEALESAELIKRYYKQRGAGDKVQIVVFNGTKTGNGHYMEITQVKAILDDLFLIQAQ